MAMLEFRAATAAFFAATLTACSSLPPLMQPAQPLSTSSEYALVTFMRPTFGTALMDPVQRLDDSGYLIWDGKEYVGELQPRKFIQIKAKAGVHIFVIDDQNIGAVYAELLAGKSYFVNVKQGLFPTRPIAEVLKPDDSRIDDWIASLNAMELDSTRWKEQQSACDFPVRRPVSTAVCRAVVGQRDYELKTVSNGHCEPTILNPSMPYCEAFEIRPGGGR